MIELRNVKKEYSKGNAALNGVSVKIERDQRGKRYGSNVICPERREGRDADCHKRYDRGTDS